MDPLINPESRCLLVVAAPKELSAVLEGFECVIHTQPAPGVPIPLDDSFDAIGAGVGKASAAAATARALTTETYGSVISIGIAGSLPKKDQSGHALEIGQTIAAARSVFSDEGVGAPDGFIPLSEIGFAPFSNNQMGMDHDPALTAVLSQLTDTTGIIATVSWCSGDDGCALGVIKRTGAVAEAMEGAAVSVAAQMIDPSIRTGELRVISNTTGHRDRQQWDLDLALGRLTHLCEQLRVLGRAD